MKLKFDLIIFYTSFILFCSCKSIKQNTSNNDLPYSQMIGYGRTRIIENKGLELITAAAHTGISFTGSECIVYSVTTENNTVYLQYELDGIYGDTLMKVEGQESKEIKIKAKSNGKHNLWIYKASEALAGPLYIKNISAASISALKKTYTKSIEFIGNSITCGAASDASQVPCGQGQYFDQGNAYMAFGSRLARALNIDYVLNSISGAGVYRNWNSDGPTLPQQYTAHDLVDHAKGKYDPKSFRPDVISIALGTNDMSLGDGIKPRQPFDEDAFITQYTSFIKSIKNNNPNAKITLTNSVMFEGQRNDLFKKYLTKIKSNIDTLFPNNPVHIFIYKPIPMRGCGYHPSVEDHKLMADDMLDTYRKILFEH